MEKQWNEYKNKYAMHLFLSDHAEYSLKFSNMQGELTTNKLLDKLIKISLTDSFILEEEGLYTREAFGDHQHFQSHSSPY